MKRTLIIPATIVLGITVGIVAYINYIAAIITIFLASLILIMFELAKGISIMPPFWIEYDREDNPAGYWVVLTTQIILLSLCIYFFIPLIQF